MIHLCKEYPGLWQKINMKFRATKLSTQSRKQREQSQRKRILLAAISSAVAQAFRNSHGQRDVSGVIKFIYSADRLIDNQTYFGIFFREILCGHRRRYSQSFLWEFTKKNNWEMLKMQLEWDTSGHDNVYSIGSRVLTSNVIWWKWCLELESALPALP